MSKIFRLEVWFGLDHDDVVVFQVGDSIQVLNLESKQLETGRITKLYVTKGVSKSEVTSASAGMSAITFD